MEKKKKVNIRKPLYPYDEWKIIENSFDVETNLQDETIFAIGNGYIGMRGNFEEGYHGPEGTSVKGTYLNGFYESESIIYGEEAYGYAKNSQTMLNVTDSSIIKLFVDGEEFHLFTGTILSYQRVLNMRHGILTRDVTWQSPNGKQVKIHIERFANLANKHLATIFYEVTPLNFDGEVKIVSEINGQVQNQVTVGDPRTGSVLSGQVLKTEKVEQEGTFAAIHQKTRNTKFTLINAIENTLNTDSEYQINVETKEQQVSINFEVNAKKNQPIRLYKYITYFTSKDYAEKELASLAKFAVRDASQKGYSVLLQEHSDYLNEFWYHSDVEILGDITLQQSIRFNEFHLLQSVGKDGKTNIGAKGITGEGYEGHYFWDTETYVFPFFLYTNPKISKKLIEYRYSILDKARERAKELSHNGALYAWRTINGEETSAYYPAGTAQYHINADIIYALKKYYYATDDIEFMLAKGAEMLFETARLWADLGDYIPNKDNRFCINDVTGPDEYTAIVNNNLFTNVMAKDHLEFATYIAEMMKDNYSKHWKELSNKIRLKESEVAEWKKAAAQMYLSYDDVLGIHPQDDSFLDKAVWDFTNTPKENYPLLLHYHPLVIYRHQVLKQADVVLAQLLQGNRFSLADKKRDFDYYEPITTHDSSLSPSVYGIMAAEIGYTDKAYDYFMRTARMDLDDINNNVKDGIHTAAMAGAWLSIFHGFAGVREYNGQLYFQPILPVKWEGYHFKITYRGRLIDIKVQMEKVEYTLLEGESITIIHNRKGIELTIGETVEQTMKRVLEAVIFDLDGVITDTAEYHYLAWKKLAEELGLPFDREFNERLKGVSRMDSLEIILEQGNTDYSKEEKQALATKKNEYYKELIQEITPKDVLPGVLELLKDLKTNGIKTALASASKNAFSVVEKLQVGEYLDIIVDAATVKKGKPDPEIFMEAATKLQVPPQNCIGIEDASSGIDAIKAANIFSIGVGTEESMQKADWFVTDTNELTLMAIKEKFLKN